MNPDIIKTPFAKMLSAAGAFRVGGGTDVLLPSGEAYSGYIYSNLSLTTSDFVPLMYFKVPADPERDSHLMHEGSLQTSDGMDIEFAVYESDSVPPQSGLVSFLSNMNMDSGRETELRQYAPFGAYEPPPLLPLLSRFNLNADLPYSKGQAFRLSASKVYIAGLHNNNAGTPTTGVFSAGFTAADGPFIDAAYIVQ